MTDPATPSAINKADIPVVILCGGMGTRIREASEKLPKPMIDIGGKPILWHIMKTYREHGFRRFVLVLGYKGDEIRRFFLEYGRQARDFTITLSNGTEPDWHGVEAATEDWEVTLVETGLTTGTGARVKHAEKYLDQPYFLLTYGDGVGSVDIAKQFDQHVASGLIGTVTGVHPTSRFGEMHVTGEVVSEFNEKPTMAEGWVSGGYFAFKREMVEQYIDDDVDTMLEKKPLQTLAADGQLGIYKHEGFWMSMDTFRDYTELNEIWDAGSPQWKIWS